MPDSMVRPSLPLCRVACLALLCAALLSSCRSVPEGGSLGGGNVDADLVGLVDAWLELTAMRPIDRDDEDDVRPEDIRRGLARLAGRAPRHTGVLVAAGVVAMQDGDLDDASQWLDRALAVDPAHVSAACLRSQLAAHQGNTDRARRVLATARLLRPASAELAGALAGIHYLDGRYEEAEVALGEAEQLLAEVERELHAEQTELKQRRRVLDDQDVHDRAALRRLDARAHELEQEEQRISQIQVNAHWHRGLVLEASGAPLEARDSYERAFEADGDDEQVAGRLRALVAAGNPSGF